SSVCIGRNYRKKISAGPGKKNPMQIPLRILGLRSVVCAFSVIGANFAYAQSPAQQVSISQPSHVLVPGELIQIKVFQEPDLSSVCIGRNYRKKISAGPGKKNPMQIPLRILGLRSVVCAFSVIGANFAYAQSPAQQVSISQPSHVLVPGELIQIKVFQEPDL